jgi:hypothetical protein
VGFRGALLAGTRRAVEGARAGAGEVFRRLSGDSFRRTAEEIVSNSSDCVELFCGSNQKHPAG